MRAAGRSFENEQIFRRANIQKKFAQRASERRKRERTAVFGKYGFRLVAFLGFDQAELLKVAGESGLMPLITPGYTRSPNLSRG